MDPGRSPRPGFATRALVALILGAALLVSAAFVAGRLTAPSVTTPSGGSAEAGFARDMQTHHQQAVQMALTVRDLTGDDEVRMLAYDIATSQQHQAGQMYGWLAAWGLPQNSSDPAMTWMTLPPLTGSAHAHDSATHSPGQRMPGLATEEQLATLGGLSGVEAEAYFLELMITHHEGGVEMAQAVLARSSYEVVTDLAESIVEAQSSEIGYMRQLLDERRA